MASEEVTKFIKDFHQAIKSQNIALVNSHYESGWPKLTEKYYKQSEWPAPEQIAPLVDNDQDFLFLYRELWFRHFYSKLSKELTLEKRVASWTNYSQFFASIAGAKHAAKLAVPAQWLWDILDEFIYQYQEFSQYASKTKDITPQEAAFLKDPANHSVWNTVAILKALHKFVDVSKIKQTLEREKRGLLADMKDPFAGSQLYQYLGYWSLISLCRVHVLLGDYYMALRSLGPIEIFNKKAKHTQVTTAYITLYYYLGFSYLMVRRYRDSIKVYSTILLYISRVKQSQTRQYDQKKNDHMYALLAILSALCPKRIDEHISNILRQEHGDKILAMQRDSEQLFSYGCPKFISPVLPSFEESDDIATHQTPLPLQRGGFMREINQQASLSTILSYLKLYSTIDLEKLVNLLEKKADMEQVRYLLDFSFDFVVDSWHAGSTPIEGKWESSTHLDFWMDGDMIHIVDNASRKKYGEIFLKSANKLEEIIDEFERKE